MNDIWNSLTENQKKNTHDILSFLTLVVAEILMLVGALTWNLIVALIGSAWSLFWFAVQCFWRR